MTDDLPCRSVPSVEEIAHVPRESEAACQLRPLVVDHVAAASARRYGR